MRRERLPEFNPGNRSNNWMVGVLLIIVFIIIAVMFGLSSNAVSGIPWLGKIIRPITPFPTPTPTLLAVSLDDLFAATQKYNGQRVTVEGNLSLPPGLLDCPKNGSGVAWCTVNLYGWDGKSSVEVSLPQKDGSPNALTTSNQFRTSQSVLLPDGSAARVSGTVTCNGQGSHCKIQMDTLETAQPPATATPPPTTVTSTPTPAARATVGTLAPTSPACLAALSVSLSNVGKNLCINGTVTVINTVNGITYIRFNADSGSFYILLYGWTWKEAISGACIQVSGEIKKLGASPVLVLAPQAPHSICP